MWVHHLRMKRIAVGSAMLVILALAGCGGSSPAASPPAAAEATPDAAAFLAAIHSNPDLGANGISFAGDDDLTSLGQSICSAIDRGSDRADIAAADTQTDAATLNAIIAAATTHLCPKHKGF
jgi:predicted small lipoprotein YifL